MSSAVFDALKRWRSRRAKEMDKPSYVVFDDKTLLGIAERRPASIDELERVKGVGRGKKLQDYGNEVLDIVRSLGDGATGAARGGPASTSTLASAWAKAGGAPREGFEKKTTTPTPSRTAPVFESKKKPSEGGSVVTEMSSEEARVNYDTKMNAEQRDVVDAVLHHGRNVFFHGAAGTGKSFVLHTLVALLREKHGASDAVAVTAPTGIAAVAIGGCTIHKFIGAGLCAGHPRAVVDKVIKSEKATRRWRRDPRAHRGRGVHAGRGHHAKAGLHRPRRRGSSRHAVRGLQLVFTGDFTSSRPSRKAPRGDQWAPVRVRLRRVGFADFRAIALSVVLRQRDQRRRGGGAARGPVRRRAGGRARVLAVPVAAATVAAQRGGCPADAAALPSTPTWTRRTATSSRSSRRFAARAFEAVDTGRRRGGSGRAAQELRGAASLSLKLGAQVVLIKNVDDALVNGSRGVVRGFVTRGDTEFARHKSSFRIHPRRADGRGARVSAVAAGGV